jgi:FAD/FMN-containing dehydrogenase
LRDFLRLLRWSSRVGDPHLPAGEGLLLVHHAYGLKQAYGENLPRLAEIKAAYDPENLFRSNR